MSASEFDEEALPCRVGAAATGISRVLAGRQELSAAFVLGGWDPVGLSLYQIEQDGTAQKVSHAQSRGVCERDTVPWIHASL